MSTQPYSVGDNVELSYTVGSTQSTDPGQAVVSLVVTNPLGHDDKYLSSQLSPVTPSSDSTSEGWARWLRTIVADQHGRWTYTFTSTGLIRSSASGAFAVAGPLASTST